MRTLPLAHARRIALAALGFDRPRPSGRVDVRHLRRVLATTQVVQLDSVNVAARAHYLPFFSRLGPYDADDLDRWLWRSRENFEYVGHEASVMPVDLYPLMRHRMVSSRPWRRVRALMDEHPGYIEQVREQVAASGPLSVSDLEHAGSRSGSWWGWNRGRLALDWLYVTGQLAIHERDRAFTIHYDVPERVLPASVREAEPLPAGRAQQALLLRAARAHGVGTARDLADHFRLPIREARAALDELARAGALREVSIPGWREVAYLHPEARRPRRIRARALLSPFDPLVWFRERAERLFGFRYRIEIYVPKQQRVHGYYVLPFLLDDQLAARVDLKSDRTAGVLRVLGAFREDGHDRLRVARELRDELVAFASWQDLRDVSVANHGDLATTLRRLV